MSIYVDAEQDFGLDPTRPQIHDAEFNCIGLLRHGMTSGKAAVIVVVNLPDGTQVVAQTSWALFHMAAVALADSPIASEETTFDA